RAVEFRADDPVASKLIIRADLRTPKSSARYRWGISAWSGWLNNLHRAPARVSANIDPRPTEGGTANPRLPVALGEPIRVRNRTQSRREHGSTHKNSHDTPPATRPNANYGIL